MMFCVGDKVAHPMHGAGVIDRIVTESVAGAGQDVQIRPWHHPIQWCKPDLRLKILCIRLRL